MLIRLYRKRLESELKNKPDMNDQSIQSYTVTTAVLLRQMIQYLNMEKGLSIPNADPSGKKPHDLLKVLHRFIHYNYFFPHWRNSTQKVPEGSHIVQLASDYHSYEDEEDIQFDLKDYFDVVSQFAYDDAFVFRHLLKETISCLCEAINKPNKDFGNTYFRKLTLLIHEVFWDVSEMVESEVLKIPNKTKITWYNHETKMPPGGNVFQVVHRHTRISFDCVDFLSEYKTEHFHYPFLDYKQEINGKEQHVHTIHWGNNTYYSAFDDLLDVFRVFQKAI